METKIGQDLWWESVSGKSREGKEHSDESPGEDRERMHDCRIKANKGSLRMGERLERYEARGMQSLPWGVDGGFGKKIKNERYEFRESGVVKRC